MHCPECGYPKTLVKDKRDLDQYTRRRRACPQCDHRFTTRETAQPEVAVVTPAG